MADAIAAVPVLPEVERLAIAEEHVVAPIDLDHRRQRLAFIRAQAVGDDLPRLLLVPCDAVAGDRMADLVGAVGRGVGRISLPAGPEDVPHVELAADDLHETVADQTGFVQRSGEHRPVADALEGQPVVAADRQADGRVHRHRDPPVPAAGVAIDGIAMAHHVHREDAVLVEATQSAERDHRLVRHANDVAQVLLHVHERDMAEVLAVGLVHRAVEK